jgi:hypothetical protein
VAVEFVNVTNQNSISATPAILLDECGEFSRGSRYAIATSPFGCLDQIGQNVFVLHRFFLAKNDCVLSRHLARDPVAAG